MEEKNKKTNWATLSTIGFMCFLCVLGVVFKTNGKATYSATACSYCPSGYTLSGSTCKKTSTTSTTTSSACTSQGGTVTSSPSNTCKCRDASTLSASSEISGTCSSNTCTCSGGYDWYSGSCKSTYTCAITTTVAASSGYINASGDCVKGNPSCSESTSGINCGSSSFTTTASGGTCSASGKSYQYTVTAGSKCDDTDGSTYTVYTWSNPVETTGSCSSAGVGINCGASSFKSTASGGTCNDTSSGKTYKYTVTSTGSTCKDTDGSTYTVYTWTNPVVQPNKSCTEVGVGIDCGASSFKSTASNGTCYNKTTGKAYSYTVTNAGTLCDDTDGTYTVYTWSNPKESTISCKNAGVGINCGASSFNSTAKTGSCNKAGDTSTYYYYKVTDSGTSCIDTDDGNAIYKVYTWSLTGSSSTSACDKIGINCGASSFKSTAGPAGTKSCVKNNITYYYDVTSLNEKCAEGLEGSLQEYSVYLWTLKGSQSGSSSSSSGDPSSSSSSKSSSSSSKSSSVNPSSSSSSKSSSSSSSSSSNIVIPSSSSDIDSNPKTGTVAICLVWILAIGTLVYAFYYFRKLKNE